MRRSWAIVLTALTAFIPALTAATQPPAVKKVAPLRFARDIQPLLSDACFKCHGPDSPTRKADLRLDTAEGIRRTFIAGKPEQSPGFQRIAHKNPALRMPPPGALHTLSAKQIDLLRRWILEGAKWEPHWAFVTPVRPAIPAVRNTTWSKNTVDRFILAKLETEKLTPSPEAPKAILIRRVTLDLTGLPPTPAEVDAFLKDKSPNAYEKVVDRLLASPRYGERMVWDWLEASRYADSNGFQEDRTRTMWPWRDWVLRAFNNNMPYDQFVVEQLAGDLLPNATRDQILATGFNRNHSLNGEGGRIPEESRVDYVMDRVETTGTVFLGVTIGCARCHDHKYDPLTKRDYYRMFAYFNNVPESGGVDAGGNANPVLPLTTPEQEKQLADLRGQLTEKEKTLKALDEKSPERPAAVKERDDVRKALDTLNNSIPAPMVMQEMPQPRESFVLTRGIYDRHEEKVTCAPPAVLPAPPADAPANRLGLARWLVSPQNPLTARVTVNRLWQMCFGTGLVKTPDDFGIQGQRPSHPELLDWLAIEFVRTGWDVKRMVRLMVTSAAYRQSSKVTPQLREKDPENRLLAHGPRYRLPSWMLRDQALAISGLLVEKQGGTPVQPYQPPGIWEEYSFGRIQYQQDHGDNLYRRSLYTYWRRSVAPTMLFDTAARTICTVRTTRTNTPLHALTLLNDTTFLEAARILAERAMREGKATPESRIAYAFRIAVSRYPKANETAALAALYQKSLGYYFTHREEAEKLLAVGERPRDKERDAAELAAYATVMNVLLNLDEVLCKE